MLDRGDTGGPGEKKGGLEEDSWKTLGCWGWGQGIPFAPGSIDKPGSQLVQAEATPNHPTPLTPSPLFSLALVVWTWYGQGWNVEAGHVHMHIKSD